MGTYSVYNSYTKPIDPQDSFVVLDSIQQSSNQNPSLTSSRKLEGLSHVIHQSQEEMVAKLEEQAKKIKLLEQELEERTSMTAQVIVQKISLEQQIKQIAQSKFNHDPNNENSHQTSDDQLYLELKKQYDELRELYNAQDYFILELINGKRGFEEERNNLLSHSQLLLEKNQKKTRKKEELRERVRQLESRLEDVQAEKLGLKETNSKLIRHVNKIHTTLEEAGLLTLNPETGKAADEAVEIAIFNLIHDRKKLEEIAHSLAKLGFIEEKANYHAIETKNAFNRFLKEYHSCLKAMKKLRLLLDLPENASHEAIEEKIQASVESIQFLTREKERMERQITQLKEITAAQRKVFFDVNEIANQKIDQVADLQQQMKNLRDSKNNVTRSLNRLIEAVKLHRGTQWIKSLDPILKDCLKEG